MVSTNVSLNNGNWNHVCVSWKSVGGEWTLYVNGSRHAGGNGLATNTYLHTGGVLVLGTNYCAYYARKQDKRDYNRIIHGKG